MYIEGDKDVAKDPKKLFYFGDFLIGGSVFNIRVPQYRKKVIPYAPGVSFLNPKSLRLKTYLYYFSQTISVY